MQLCNSRSNHMSGCNYTPRASLLTSTGALFTLPYTVSQQLFLFLDCISIKEMYCKTIKNKHIFVQRPTSTYLKHVHACNLRNRFWLNFQEHKCKQQRGAKANSRKRRGLLWQETAAAPPSEYIWSLSSVCIRRGRKRMAQGRLGGRWSGGRRSFASCFLTQGSLFALLYYYLEWTYGRLAENLYLPHNVHRCSIEPEDIPFQGFEGGAIVAFLLQVRNHIFYSFCCQDVRGAQTDVVRGKIRQEVWE